MHVLASLPAFLSAVLLISASPGPAMALIFRRAAVRGLRGAVPRIDMVSGSVLIGLGVRVAVSSGP